jgi:hypothetical protein
MKCKIQDSCDLCVIYLAVVCALVWCVFMGIGMFIDWVCDLFTNED